MKTCIFLDDAWFISNSVVNSQNNRRSCYEIPHAVC